MIAFLSFATLDLVPWQIFHDRICFVLPGNLFLLVPLIFIRDGLNLLQHRIPMLFNVDQL